MRRRRLVLGALGVALGGYGAWRLFAQTSPEGLRALAVWLVVAVAIHDGLVAPMLLGAGRALTLVPARARRFVQVGLVVGALLVVIAVPQVYREDTQPGSEALLVRNYAANLGLLLALVAGVSLLLYAESLARSKARRRWR